MGRQAERNRLSAVLDDEVLTAAEDDFRAGRGCAAVLGEALVAEIRRLRADVAALSQRVSYPGLGRNDAEWEVLPTPEHLAGDESEAPGTGPAGRGIYLAGMPEDGYFAWFRHAHEAAARNVVDQHNEAVRGAAEAERLMELLVELVGAKDAVDVADSDAGGAVFTDAPDSDEKLAAQVAAQQRLEDAFEAAAKELGEENVGNSGEVAS